MTDTEATRRRALQIAAGVAAVSAIGTTTASAAVPDVVGAVSLLALIPAAMLSRSQRRSRRLAWS